MAEFAENGPFENKLEDKTPTGQEPTSVKRKKNVRLIRKKRLKRNQKKRKEIKNLSKQERRNRIHEKITKQFKDGLTTLKSDLLKSQQLYQKERRISEYCWWKWKKEHRLHLRQKLITETIKRICSENLRPEVNSSPNVIGKGCFGRCFKMEYRGICVAVKEFDPSVTVASVLHEATVINQLDHPGLPLLFGVSVYDSPFLMVTQFHGIDGKCVTLNKAHKINLMEKLQEWARIFKEIVEALQYVHGKGLIHNDIKGDNVVITRVDNYYHSVLIDFGKCRKIENAKQYVLTREEQIIHRKRHWHIAPELVKGTHRQSYKSDIFSFGVMINTISMSLQCKQLTDLAKQCIGDSPSNRPSLTYICRKLTLS